MRVQKLTLAQAKFERSPGQDSEIYAANLIDQRHGGPVSIGYGRYAPHQALEVTLAVHDTMIVIEGDLWVDIPEGELHAGPGEIVYLPQGQTVTILSKEREAITAYVTYPHWQEAES